MNQIPNPILEELLEILRTLRGPNGCPWDQKQTHESLIKHLREETEEVCAEIEQGNLDNDFKEELGDLLLQVLMHSILAEEAGRFTMKDVMITLKEKLIFRHPHVFGDNPRSISEEELDIQWAELKAQEKARKL